LEKVYNYILNQKVHHKKKTFTQEYEAFLESSGIDKRNFSAKANNSANNLNHDLKVAANEIENL